MRWEQCSLFPSWWGRGSKPRSVLAQRVRLLFPPWLEGLQRQYKSDLECSSISEEMLLFGCQLSLQIPSSMPRIEEQWPLDFPKFRWGLLAELCEKLGGEDHPACMFWTHYS